MATDLVLISPHVRRRLQHRDWAPSKYLGLAYLAAACRRQGFSVQVIDAKGDGLTPEKVADRLRSLAPRVIGFTAMTHELGRAAELAALARDAVPGALHVVGGAHASALPERTLTDHPQFDAAAVGESENTMVEIVQVAVSSTQTGGPLDLGGVAGIAWRAGDTVRLTGCRASVENLDGMALPAWDLFPWTPHFPVFSARGCPYQCNFCMRAMGTKYRFRSEDDVIAELEELVGRHRATSVTFEDETFMVKRDRTRNLLDRIIQAGLHTKLRWMANLHAKTVDLDLAKHLKAAGCVSIGTGVESGNPEVLKRAGKGLTVDGAARAVATLREAGLEVRAFFIFGHPDETWSTAMDTVRLAGRLAPDQASFGIMVPYPNTEVARMVEAGEGGYRRLSLDWADYDKYLGGALELEGLPRWKLEVLQVLAYLWLYLRSGRVGAMLRFFLKNGRAGLALVARWPRSWLARARAG